MADTDVRVRFAPSPTGFLHVGGVRTALFNWLFARKVGGRFLVRIEDTDRARSSDEHTRVILDGLRWLGLNWDEEVVFQGAGLARHQRMARRLLETGHAYQDGGAIRFRMPAAEIAFEDIVHGTIAFDGTHINDWIILRSDETPTYNFSVVVDDIDMRISHVLRGDDHISNTPKQIAVYQALGATPPRFGHVPNVHGTDGKKLSKRHGATAIGDYRVQGYLPRAMVNFLALLGWNPGDDRELFFTMEDLIDAFSLDDIQKKSAIFDPQKLEWMNGQHISQTSPEALLTIVAPELSTRYGLDASGTDRLRLLRTIAVVRERARTILHLAWQIAVRHDASFVERDEKATKLIKKDPSGFRDALHAAAERLERVNGPDWDPAGLEAELRGVAESHNVGAGKIMQPIRIALTGGTVSEPVNELLCVVGREESLRRMAVAQTWGNEDSESRAD